MGEQSLDRSTGLTRRQVLGSGVKGAALSLAAAGGLRASTSRTVASPAAGVSRRTARHQSKTKISFAWPFTNPDQQPFADRFNEQSTSVEVEVQIIPFAQAVPRFTTAFSADAGPDCVAMSPAWLAQFAAAGWLENLEDFLKSSGVEQQLLPVAMAQGRLYDNTAYMAGFLVDVFPLYYNRQHFDEAGLAGPPATLEEFAEYAKKLTDSSKNRFGYYLSGGEPAAFQQYSTWMLNYGGIGVNNTLYDADGKCVFSNPEAVAGLDRWLALYQEDKVSPPASATSPPGEAANVFNAEQVSMVFGFLGGIGTSSEALGADKFGVAMPPAGPAGQFFHFGCNGYAINSQSENKEAAWEYIQWLLSPEINELLNEEWGAIPANLEALNAEWLTGPLFEAPLAMAQQAEAHVHTPRHLPDWPKFQVEYNLEQIQRTLLGDQTSAEFATNVSTYLNDALASGS